MTTRATMPEGFDYSAYKHFPACDGTTVDAILMPWGYVYLYQQDARHHKIAVQSIDLRPLGEFLIACADAMEGK